MNQGTMFNAYPDSIGTNMSGMAEFLSLPQMKNAFRSFYVLPTAFNTDLDRGFSVISYDLCPSLVTEQDLSKIRSMQIELTFDLILNHLSVLSPQFQDILRNGEASPYRDFFIDWNRFWAGRGEMGEDGMIHPDPEEFLSAHLRKKSLPVLMVRLPDGRDVPYWNTFYQKVVYPEMTVFDALEMTDSFYDRATALAQNVNDQLRNGCTPEELDFSGMEAYREPVKRFLQSRRQYLGQMDVNVNSPLVWEWYDQTLSRLAGYGATLIRLDAFTRLHKAPRRENFMNEPETWEILERLRKLAKTHGLEVLPEIHATYASGAYRKLHQQGCAVYDYFLPALLIDAMETGDVQYLYAWAEEMIRDHICTISMLGCHDGIPMHDVRGLLPDERIADLIACLEHRGGRRKMIHGANPEVYQMDMTYYSALGCDDRKMMLARAVQMFLPGRPQVWYVDLLAGKNDVEIFQKDPSADSREMNRHAYSFAEAEERMKETIVQEQIKLLQMRNTHPAFAQDAEVQVHMLGDGKLEFVRTHGAASAHMKCSFRDCTYSMELKNGDEA